jgi:hypothetical protein
VGLTGSFIIGVAGAIALTALFCILLETSILRDHGDAYVQACKMPK